MTSRIALNLGSQYTIINPIRHLEQTRNSYYLILLNYEAYTAQGFLALEVRTHNIVEPALV